MQEDLRFVRDLPFCDIPYSGKYLLGANFCDFHGQTCFCKIFKNAKISSEESGHISVKFCTSENFPLYGSNIVAPP